MTNVFPHRYDLYKKRKKKMLLSISSINVCPMGQFLKAPNKFKKSPHLETFFVHFELLAKSNHLNLYQFECIIKHQYLFNRIILKIQGLM